MSEAVSRRTWLYAGVAGAAALVGVGLGAARWGSPQAVNDEADAKALAQLWGSSFDAPGGEKVAMQGFRGKPLLLNFWATWCPPCVDELPLLNRFYDENRGNGWQIVGIAVDKLESVKAFLQRLPLAFPVAMAPAEGMSLAKALGDDVSALPFSVLLGRDGAVLARKIGRLSPEDLARWSKLG
jgi:thiol-disulfide isomerase/thioredoxin